MIRYMKYKVLGSMVGLTLAAISCTDMYNLSSDKDFISDNLTYSANLLEPRLGRTTVLYVLDMDISPLAVTFDIINPRFGDGRPATAFLQTASTYEWTAE